MSYVFEGQTFSNLAEFQRAFPVYRAYIDQLKAGASTVLEMEKAIKEKRDNWLASSKRQARANNAFNLGKNRRKT